MRVAIVGGGIMGVSLGYFLTQAGVCVEIFEASSSLGGLAGEITLEDGTKIDRFYHAILSSDTHMQELSAELQIEDKLRFNETRMGFYHQGEVHPMNGMVDFFRFPPLGWIDRFRLGLTVLYSQFVRDWHTLEGISVEEWLLRWSGRGTYENIWKPMLKAKFDGGFDSTPATYIWSRLVRMKSARKGINQKELVGHLIGGHITLVHAMADEIRKSGGLIHLNHPIEEIMIEKGEAWGLRIGGEAQTFDAIVSTLQTPIFQRLIPEADPSYHDYLSQTEYLGIISPLLVLDRPLSGYWTLNITEDRIPFTGIIETTTYIDPKYVGGHHLVYLPKYTVPGSSWTEYSDDEVREIWFNELEGMFPNFERSWVRHFLIHRERYVEPLHTLNSTHLIPPVETPVSNLFLATTSQIYPGLTNGESVSRHAHQVAQTMLNKQLSSRQPQPCQTEELSINERISV